MEKIVSSSEIPESLSFYRGGLNVGIFYPGPPVTSSGSAVIGNEFTGKARSYSASGDGNGSQGLAWALIISPNDINNFSFRNANDPVIVKENSTYDGQYNKMKLGPLEKNKLLRYSPNGYRDWYVPSRDELAFIAQNLPKDYQLPLRFTSMKQTYLSSTYVSQNVGENPSRKFSLLLTQSFSDPTYGDTFCVSDTKLMAIRLVRKVPVYII